jgi:hypothetical protein
MAVQESLPVTWCMHRDSHVGRVARVTRWIVDPSVDGWILWKATPDGFMNEVGVYDTLDAAKAACRP